MVRTRQKKLTRAGKPDLPMADRATPCRVRVQLSLHDGRAYRFWSGAASYAIAADLTEAVDLYRTIDACVRAWWKERGGP